MRGCLLAGAIVVGGAGLTLGLAGCRGQSGAIQHVFPGSHTIAPRPQTSQAGETNRPAPTARGGAPIPTPLPDPGTVTCPTATTTVTDAAQLTAALLAARPGDSIELRDGVYRGTFAITTPGTRAEPTYLCGSAKAVLDGGGVTGGYALHLDGASYWRLVGFGLRDAQKGIVADRTQHAVIESLAVSHIGDEAIHLRTASSDNLVAGNVIDDTGVRRAKFGEGIYVGSAKANWCTYTGCKPDRSDRNQLRGNTITGTRSECIDVKEGTTGGVVIGNELDGAALSGADSWVDINGNGWLIQSNSGQQSPADGYQTHAVAEGWGTRNVFAGNVANVDGPGFGFHLAPVLANRVTCDNRAVRAGRGLTNTTCS
jgi:Right handed beta helix region